MLDASSRAGQPRPTTFLTNHAHVLIAIATDPDIRLREVATRVGVTERAAQRIAADLAEGGYLTARRVGRRNRYTVNDRRPLSHPLEAHRTVGHLLALGPDGTKEDL